MTFLRLKIAFKSSFYIFLRHFLISLMFLVFADVPKDLQINHHDFHFETHLGPVSPTPYLSYACP